MRRSVRRVEELTFDLKGDLYFAERDNNVIRKVDMKTGIISTAAGTGVAGYGRGDGGPAPKAQLRQPHSVIRDKDGSLLICDLANHRIRRLRLDTGIIETWAGTGEGAATPEGAPVSGTPVNGPRSLVLALDGDLYVALRREMQFFGSTRKRIGTIASPAQEQRDIPAMAAPP